MTDFPLPGAARAAVGVPAPGGGVGWWAGSSSAVLDVDGTFVVAYRLRTGERGRGFNVVARSEDGEHFSTACTIEQDRAAHQGRRLVEWHGTVLAGRPGMWDARGARLTAILPDGRAAYNGRATKDA